MKTILSITSVMILLAIFTSSCKKDSSNQDVLNANLKTAETKLQQSYQVAKTNDDLLKIHVTAGGHFTDPNTMMEDSLYHKNDSLCNQFYLTYCKDMMDGDNMMGGNMMGGNTMHGSGMMATHSYMGDTAIVNQCYRNLNTMRLGHSAHHPVK
jgi:hypothetical protein